MAKFLWKRSEELPVTHALAAKFSTMLASPTERGLDDGREDYLKGQVTGGLAIPFKWAIGMLDGVEYRLNGLHSSTMLTKLDGSLPEGLIAHIDYYDVDDMEGLVLLFQQIDPRWSARSKGDVAGAHQGVVPALVAVPRDPAKRGVDGVAWYLRHVIGVPVPAGDAVYTLFNDQRYHDFLIWLGQTLSVKTRELHRNPIIAAVWGTYEKDPIQAKDWWREVARGGTDDEKAPATVLDTWLRNLISNDKAREKVKEGNIFQGCIFAWNSMRNGKAPSNLRFNVDKGFADID